MCSWYFNDKNEENWMSFFCIMCLPIIFLSCSKKSNLKQKIYTRINQKKIKSSLKNMSRELLTKVKHFSKTISQEVFMVCKISKNNCLLVIFQVRSWCHQFNTCHVKLNFLLWTIVAQNLRLVQYLLFLFVGLNES